MSNFTDVSKLNTVFGNDKGDPTNPNWKAIKKQLQLILEEAEELQEGVEKMDFTEMRDAVSDILVVTYGMAHIMGIDADKDMAAVDESNMSKLCKTEEEVENTLAHYREQGLEVYAGGELPEAFVKSAIDQEVGGKFYPEHKFLKNTLWHEPEFV